MGLWFRKLQISLETFSLRCGEILHRVALVMAINKFPGGEIQNDVLQEFDSLASQWDWSMVIRLFPWAFLE